MTPRFLLAQVLLTTAVFAQQPAPPKPAAAPAKPAPAAAKPAAPPATAPKPATAAAKPPAPKPAAPAKKPAETGTTVDTVVELVKGGLSEDMIIQTLKNENKTFALSATDLLKLQKGGVSQNIVKVMMNPKVELAAAAPPPPPSAPAEPQTTVLPVPTAPAAPVKRRIAVTAFDYSSVKSAVTFWFKNDVNIGQGIRAMLTDRLAKTGQLTLLEREKVDKLLGEQDLGASSRSAQGTKARIGKIKGTDAILFGDIVTFGRDDVKKNTGFGGAVAGHFLGGWAKLNKEEKAVVVINFRIVDSETGEIIETGEARGESSRKSKNWGAVLGTPGAVGGAGASMESSNFAETIIGEATKDAVDKLAADFATRISKLPPKKMEVEGRVAQIAANGTLYLNVGSSDGVQPTDRFEIHKIMDVVMDPVTKEVLDQRTEKVGDMSITTVRDRVTIGNYQGAPLDATYAKGYAARKVN